MENYVSVIIPTYNREKFIAQSVGSVLAQTYPRFELIVVDDGSTDRTAELVARLRAESDPERIIYIRQENQGPAAARNAGIRAARYDLLAFLDSDDRFVEGKLEAQVALMEANPDALISHTDEVWFRRGVRLNPKNKHRKSGGDLFARCLELCVVGMSTVMARRDFFERAGWFSEDFFCCEDYDLWLRASAELPFFYLDRALTVKDGGRSDQLSVIHRLGMDKLRIKSIVRLLDSARLDPGQEEMAITELIRKCTIYGQGCLKHGREEEGRYYLELPIRRQMTEDRGQMTEDRGQRTEDRRQKTEDRRQRTEDRGQKTEDRRQMTEDRGQKTEDRGQRTEDRGQRTEDRGQKTEDRGQRTEDRGQRTEDRGQRTEDRGQRTEDRKNSGQWTEELVLSNEQ